MPPRGSISSSTPRIGKDIEQPYLTSKEGQILKEDGEYIKIYNKNMNRYEFKYIKNEEIEKYKKVDSIITGVVLKKKLAYNINHYKVNCLKEILDKKLNMDITIKRIIEKKSYIKRFDIFIDSRYIKECMKICKGLGGYCIIHKA